MRSMTGMERAVFEGAIRTWGVTAQVTMVFEEMSELQKELCKQLRGGCVVDHIAEEIADVEIMLDQMKILYNIQDDVSEQRKKKVERLLRRLGMDK